MSSDGGGTAWNPCHRCRILSRNDRLRDLSFDRVLVVVDLGERDLEDGMGDVDFCLRVRCVTTDLDRDGG